MKKYDVLLTYETKNREVENLCLIKWELERRGYSVGMCMQYDTYFEIPEPVEAKVVVIPAYYRPRAQFYTASHLVKTEKIINMQWEQVFTKKNENDPGFIEVIKPWGREAVHICWGSFSFKRSKNEWLVPENRLKVTGHVALDFLRPELRDYFKTRNELFEEYNIPADKCVHLFISSLSCVEMHDRVLKNSLANKTPENIAAVFLNKKRQIETQKELLTWFENALKENEDDIIIYRPHPEEKNSQLLQKLQAKQPRFRVVSQESVKQWILVCDKLYTWMSTSVAEIYASGKGCDVLRPVPIPEDLDYRYYYNSKHIASYQEFLEAFHVEKQEFGIEKTIIDSYYDIHPQKLTYQRVADVIEDVLKNDEYKLSVPMINPLFNKKYSVRRFENWVKRVIRDSKMFEKLSRSDFAKGTKFKENLDDIFYVKEKLLKNYATDEEINSIVKRIDQVLSY